MLTHKQIKLINSLANKKFRDEYGLFVAEGRKLVNDLTLNGLYIEMMVEGDDCRRISGMKTASDVVAVFHKPKINKNLNINNDEIILLLDRIQDPGNMGTIIRTADWFGVKNIICSMDCVDCYSPKVVQATMGSIGRVNIWEEDLVEVVKNEAVIEVYGTFLDGENIYKSDLKTPCFLIFGNEGNGISEEVGKLVKKRLLIPKYGSGESLNVGVSVGVVLSEISKKAHT